MKNKLVEDIKRIALQNIDADVKDEESLIAFLKRWWSRYYNRPRKDPLLLEYSVEELLLEFFENVYLDDETERHKVKSEMLLKESGEDFEEQLKEELGDAYQTPEEMAQNFREVKENVKT
jgi:hypothetical protein